MSTTQPNSTDASLLLLKLPPTLPTELILLILQQHILNLSHAFHHPSSTAPTQSNGSLPLLLSSSHLHSLLLPLLYSHPYLSSPAQAQSLLHTLASQPSYLSLPGCLRAVSHRGELSASFTSLISGFGSRVDRLELLGVPGEAEVSCARGSGGGGKLWGVMGGVSPRWGVVQVVLKGEEGKEGEERKKRRKVGCMKPGWKRAGWKRAVPAAEGGGAGVGVGVGAGGFGGAVERKWEEKDEREMVGGRVWEVVEAGVRGWGRWEGGRIEVREG